jgi:glucokinase
MPDAAPAHGDDLDAAAPTYLAGDIGGTNCRLALAQVVGGRIVLRNHTDYKCAEFPQASDAIQTYLTAAHWTAPLSGGVLAVAGPIRDGVVQATNMRWKLSEADLRRHGVTNARLINDYTALALAVNRFGAGDLVTIGPDVPGDKTDTVAVMGAGTGFGSGALARGVGGSAAIATEGGHISFAPVDDVEIQMLKILRRMFGRVSIERILSGVGLVNIHAVLSEIEGLSPSDLSAEAITAEAKAVDGLSRRALMRFCAIYGSVAGDLALVYGARGGVYLGGGIAPAICDQLLASQFRARFEDKGRFRDYLEKVPTKIVTNTHAALLGSASLAARLD